MDEIERYPRQISPLRESETQKWRNFENFPRRDENEKSSIKINDSNSRQYIDNRSYRQFNRNMSSQFYKRGRNMSYYNKNKHQYFDTNTHGRNSKNDYQERNNYGNPNK